MQLMRTGRWWMCVGVAVVLVCGSLVPDDAVAARRSKRARKHKKDKSPARPATETPADDKQAAAKSNETLHTSDSQYGEAAMAQLKIARLFYKERKFKQAAVAFHQAYSLQERVEFLFNAARSEQRAMQLELAEKHFKACLTAKDAPEAVVRRAKVHIGEIGEMRAALQKARESGKKSLKPIATIAADPPPKIDKPAPKRAPIEPVAPPAGTWKSTAGWGTVAAGTVLLGLGGYLAASYSSGQADLDARLNDRDSNNKVKAIDFRTYDSEQQALNGTAALGTSALVVGAVAAGAGAWMLLTAPKGGGAAKKATLVPMGTRGLAFVVSF